MIIRKRIKSVLFLLLVSINFFASADLEVKETTPSIKAQLGKFAWADLYTGNVKSSLDFYTDTFGWTVKKFGKKNTRYHLLYDGTKPVAGVLARSAQRNKTEKALWIGSVVTDNVQKNVKNAVENNATVILKPHDFLLYGTRAVIADPQGGVIALVEFDESNQAHKKISDKWNWAQLFSINTEKAASFYKSTLNYSIEKVSQNKQSFYLSQQSEVRASIVTLPNSFEQRDRWVSFIDVNNLSALLVKATKNGAEIIYESQDNQLAIIADPNGALLGLTEQESE